MFSRLLPSPRMRRQRPSPLLTPSGERALESALIVAAIVLVAFLPQLIGA